MRLSEIRQGVYYRLGVKTTDPQFKADAVTAFCNDALRQISVAHSWPWLDASETITTADGDDSYSPSSTSGSVWGSSKALVVTISGVPYPLTRYDRDTLDDLYDTATRGQPEAFAVYADEIILRPVPDGIYTLTHRYQKAEKILLSDSDEPYLPDTYAPSVCDLATVLALGRSKEDARAQSALSRYTAWLQDMTENRRRGRKPQRIRVRPGGWI